MLLRLDSLPEKLRAVALLIGVEEMCADGSRDSEDSRGNGAVAAASGRQPDKVSVSRVCGEGALCYCVRLIGPWIWCR